MVKLNNQLPIVRPVIEGGNGRINYNHGKKNKIRDNPMGMGSPQQLFMNPRLFLLVACLWPLVVLALFTASAPGQKDSRAVVSDPSALSQQESSIANNKNGFNLRNVLDRVDIMGYGPTHPRVAFVVVGEDRNALIQSIESIFSNTDMKRIFIARNCNCKMSENRQLKKLKFAFDKHANIWTLFVFCLQQQSLSNSLPTNITTSNIEFKSPPSHPT